MGLEAGGYVNDLDIANPVGAVDKRHQGDDHIRLIKTALKATFPNASKPFRFPSILSKSANYTVLSSDANATIFVDTTSAQIDITLPTLAAGDAGWEVRVVKSTTDINAVRVVGTINGESNMLVNNRYEVLDLIWSGSAWLGTVDLNGYRIAIITGDLTATEDHLDGIILSTPTGANKTITLPAVANYRGRMLSVHHTGNTYTTTLDGNAAETINGAATLVLSATNQSVVLVAMATGWVVLAQGGGATATAAEAIAATDASKFVTPAALKPFGRQGANIASAGTITVTDDGDFFHVTGTTTITDIDMTTDATGREFTLVFDGALTLTHNATTLILPGGANITTVAGDAFTFRSEGSDVVRCVGYSLASGRAAVAPAGGTWQRLQILSPTSGTTVVTSDLSAYKGVRLTFAGLVASSDADISVSFSNDGTTKLSGIDGNGFQMDATPAATLLGFSNNVVVGADVRGGTTNCGVTGEFMATNINSTTAFKSFQGLTGYRNGGNVGEGMLVSGVLESATQVKYLIISCGAGTFAAGDIYVEVLTT